MTAVDIGLAAVFGVWLAGTVINAGRPGADVVRRLGAFGYLVPVWNFFAPYPAIHDFQVLYRDRLASGALTPWKEGPRHYAERPWSSPLWNPRKVHKKAIFDLAISLQTELSRGQEADVGRDLRRERLWVRLSVPYLHFLEYVSNIERPLPASETQFVVVRFSVDGEARPVPILVSEFHRVDPPPRED